MRERFTFRGDSLWWFTELYLHKEQAILTIMRTIVRVRRIDRRRAPATGALGPWRSGVGVGHPRAESDATRAVSRSRGRAMVVGPASAGPADARDGASRGGDSSEAARRRGGGASGSVIAFVHRAFSASRAATAPGGEWYIGSVLQQIASRVPAGVLRLRGRRAPPEFSRTTVVAGVPGRRGHQRSSNSRPIPAVKNGGTCGGNGRRIWTLCSRATTFTVGR